MEIPEIKSRLALSEVIGHYGHTPDRHGRIRCPFHEDGTPSLQLYPRTNTWHCFGCGKGSDQIDFIRLKEGCGTHEAIMKAQALMGTVPQATPPTPTPPAAGIPPAQRIAALAQAFTYFARSIHGRDGKPKKYLTDRSLDANKITVGYDAHSFDKSKEVTPAQKEIYVAVGLLYPDRLGRANSYHSFFGGCVVFPTYNAQGEIVNLYGRCIGEGKESKHRYLPGKHQGIYPHYPKAETERLILTESIIDAATLLQIPAITEKYEILGCYGVNNFTAEHQQALKALQALQEVILFYDGDEAGRAAVAAHTQIITTLKPGIKVSHVDTPDNEDINSLAQGHEAGVFTQLLNNRKLFPSQERQESQALPAGPSPTQNQGPTAYLDGGDKERLLFEDETLRATVWGGIDLHDVRKLRATLHLQGKTGHLEYRDTVDLYSHGQTSKLIREAAERLETGTIAMARTVTRLTQSLERYRQGERDKERARAEAERERGQERFTEAGLRQGEALLRDKRLMEETERHIKEIGLTGEEEKGMLLFFILLTRMSRDPLHALVQGKSGSGKTYLLKKIASLVPKAHICVTTALTENTLYHSPKDFWRHKVLLIEDLDGASGALLPLREMMSNQSIGKVTTEKNMRTGAFEQRVLHVEGPVCVAGATTKDSIYEDNANRSFLIQVNETREHQEKVLEYQRREIAGLMDNGQAKEARLLFKAAQLQLEPLEVVIPFGEDLRIPGHVFKKLRTNAHYLTLIKAIAFWHQKQRAIKAKADGTRYIEATLEDVAWANRLGKETLLRKGDELSGALRGFFEQLKGYLREEKSSSFFASHVRTRFRMHPQQLRRYLEELRQRGHIHQTGRNQKTGFEYQVHIWDDYQILQNGMGVLDKVLEELNHKYRTVKD